MTPNGPTKPAGGSLPVLAVANRAELRAWLEHNHASSPGVNLAIGKKGGHATALTYDEAVEEALCFGWIDSTARRLDEDRYPVLYTPRRRGGTWARTNKARVERLTAEGRMTPAGIAIIEAAKADGSWMTLEDAENLVMPDDLALALTRADARDRFDALPVSARQIALYWISTAKRDATRAERVSATVNAALEVKLPAEELRTALGADPVQTQSWRAMPWALNASVLPTAILLAAAATFAALVFGLGWAVAEMPHSWLQLALRASGIAFVVAAAVGLLVLAVGWSLRKAWR